MTLETLYYVTQIIAVGLILISLVAIYIQQRKDHTLARVENQRDILQQCAQWFDDMLSSPTGLESVRACVQNFRNADPRQQAEFEQFMIKSVMLAEQAYYMHEERLINDNSYQRIVMLPVTHLVTPGGREYWADVKSAYGPDVVRVIDELLETEAPPLDTVYQIFPYLRPRGEAPS